MRPFSIVLLWLIACPFLGPYVLLAQPVPGLSILDPIPQAGELAGSDVVFSTRWKRPEAVDVAHSFAANKIYWLYPEKGYVAQLRAQGFSVGATINANMKVPPEGLARDFDGNPLVAPWMQSWQAQWISSTSPATLAACESAIRGFLHDGVASVQFDDPQLDWASLSWGGDFSDSAVSGFSAFLKQKGPAAFPRLPKEAFSNDFDYRSWLKVQGGVDSTQAWIKRKKDGIAAAWEMYHLQSVRAFFGALRKTMVVNDRSLTKPVSLSFNLSDPLPDRRTFAFIDLPDFLMSEVRPQDPASTALEAATVRSVGKGFLPSLTPTDTAQTRRQIMQLYALGALPLIPWDVYMPQSAPRYFGSVNDYGDLYRFVKEHGALFNGWLPASSVLVVCAVESFDRKVLLETVTNLQTAGVPFSLAVVQAGIPVRVLDRERTGKASALLVIGKASSFDAETQKILLENQSKILDDSSLVLLPSLSPFQVDRKDVIVIPRLNPDKPKSIQLQLVSMAVTEHKALLHLTLGKNLRQPEKISYETLGVEKVTEPKLINHSIDLDLVSGWGVLSLEF